MIFVFLTLTLSDMYENTSTNNMVRRKSLDIELKPSYELRTVAHNKIITNFKIKMLKRFNKKLDAGMFFSKNLECLHTILEKFGDEVDKFDKLLYSMRSKDLDQVKILFLECIDKIYINFFTNPNFKLIMDSKQLLEVTKKTRIKFLKQDVVDFCVKYFIYCTLIGENVMIPMDEFKSFFLDLRYVSKDDYRLNYGGMVGNAATNMHCTLASIFTLIYNSRL